MSNIPFIQKQITLPALSFKDQQIAYVRIEAGLTKSADVSDGEDGRNQATVCRVTDLKDGEEKLLICPSLMVSGLAVEGDKYVGKCYMVKTSKQVLPGKRYKDCKVYEIDAGMDYTEMPVTEEGWDELYGGASGEES